MGIPLLWRIRGSTYLWDMPKTTAPQITSSEVAQRVGDNTNSILAERGLTLEWVAGEIGIDAQAIRDAFLDRVEVGLLFGLAGALEIAPDSLIEVSHA